MAASSIERYYLYAKVIFIGGKYTVRAQGLGGLWDYVKEKLGFKEQKKSAIEGNVHLPVNQHAESSAEQETPLREIWKPGYRGPSARWAKREMENDGFMSRLKKIFITSSERARKEKTMLWHVESGGDGKNMDRLLHHPEKAPVVWYSTNQRQMSLLSSLRAVFGLNPKNVKPAPIREPDMPPKQEKDERSEKKEKKPVVQTGENGEEEVTHVHSAMMDEHGKPVTEENFVRTEWGVRIKDQARKVDPHADAVGTIEKPFYVERPLWGVNVKQFMTRPEASKVNPAILNSKSIESSDKVSTENSNHNVSSHKNNTSGVKNFSSNSPSLRESKKEMLQGVEQLSPKRLAPFASSSDSDTAHRVPKKTTRVKNHSDFRKKKSRRSRETLTTGTDRKTPNDSETFVPGDEIKAWKVVAERSKNRLEKQEKLLQPGKFRGISMQPEPPESKQDFKPVPARSKRHPATGGRKPSENLFTFHSDDPTSKKLHTETEERNKSSGDSGSDTSEEKSLKSGDDPWGERVPHKSKEHAVKATLNSKDILDRVQTIHPDVTSTPRPKIGSFETARNEASELVQQPSTSVSTKLRPEDASMQETVIRQQTQSQWVKCRRANIELIHSLASSKEMDVSISNPQCQPALESPRTITKRIEAYVARGAREEERRAQKALILLKARDQQISLLERRVAQLENAAADMHAITLQVQMPSPEISDKTSYFSLPRGFPTTPESQEDVNNGDGSITFDKDQKRDSAESGTGEKKIEEEHAVIVPELNFYSSPLSDSENDVFSTPVSPGSEKNDRADRERRKSSENVSSAAISKGTVYSLRNESPECTSSKQTSVDTLPRGKTGKHVRQASSTGVNEPDEIFTTKTCNVNVDEKILSEISGQIPDSNCSLTLLMAAAALLQSKKIAVIKRPNDHHRFDNGRGVDGSTMSFSNLESSRSVKLSPSVPWVRVKRRLRRKSRRHDPGLATKAEAIHRAKDVGRPKLGFDTASKSLPSMNGLFADSNKRGTEGQNGDVAQTSDSQGATLADLTPCSDHKTALSKKPVIIQAATVQVNQPSGLEPLFERSGNNELQKLETLPRTSVREDKKPSKYWSADDEPAPQWLIEEALSRGRELSVINRYDKANPCSTEITQDVSFPKTKYEEIISDLNAKLNDIRDERDVAYKERTRLKEKFKRTLRNTKMEAMKENEILQEKIVQICSSVLEKFGPFALNEKKGISGGTKGHRQPLKRYGKLTKKLQRKLRSNLVTSSKLRDELAKTKEVLGEKTRQHESLNKSFSRLKQELETAELNLNDLINENTSLRKKFEDTREWMELKIGKDRNERNNFIQLKDMQKSRDIINLRKKVDEDFATITQLRNKLLRSESANANKSFLLNSYKGQLADLAKEKEQGLCRNKELENNLVQLRSANAQLKAKISLLLNQKEKLNSENEKSEFHSKEKLESKLTLKYEESMLQEIESMKLKCDELLQAMRDRMNAAENCSSEYSAAISEFLRQLNNRIRDMEMDTSFGDGEASHREAHKTACTILNMTPKELSGFMRGRPANKINTWLTDFRKITSRENFSDTLANFLFTKVSGSI